MNPTNGQELRELAHIIMNADTPYDAMQFVKDHTNAEIAKVLERLEQDDAKLTDGRHLELDIPSWVEAERAKLKEVK